MSPREQIAKIVESATKNAQIKKFLPSYAKAPADKPAFGARVVSRVFAGPEHGDYTTSVAPEAASVAHLPPRQITEVIKSEIGKKQKLNLEFLPAKPTGQVQGGIFTYTPSS